MANYSPHSEFAPIFNSAYFLGSTGVNVLTNTNQIITGQKTFTTSIISSSNLALTFSSDLTLGIVFNNGFLSLQYKVGTPFFIAENSIYGGIFNALYNNTVILPPGSTQYPTFQFINNGTTSATGFYCPADYEIGISCNNSQVANFTNSGLTIPSTKTLSCLGNTSLKTLNVSSTSSLQNTNIYSNLELLGSGVPGTYNGVMTIGNSQNPSAGSWGIVYHKTVNITSSSPEVIIDIKIVGSYGAAYLLLTFAGSHNGTSGAVAKADLYFSMNGANINLNSQGGSVVNSGSGNLGITGSGAASGTIPLLGFQFVSSQEVQLTLQCNNSPGAYDIFVNTQFGSGCQWEIF